MTARTMVVYETRPEAIKVAPLILDLQDHEALSKQAIEQAETVALLVDHLAFKEIRLGDLDGKSVIDTRGLWSLSKS